jgi:hypothetical protein
LSRGHTPHLSQGDVQRVLHNGREEISAEGSYLQVGEGKIKEEKI